jgi:8-oxo-dGTP pyrophosphatase MutT (NUDIX family)
MKKIIPEDAVLVPDEATLAFKGMIFDTYQWPQALFDGSSHTFEMLKRPDTVTAICVVEGEILVIDDEQPYLGSRRSFPGGRVDETDASIEAAAQREVLEETGYSFQNWRLVKVSQPYRKMEWFVYVFLAWDVAGQQPAKLDAGERITVQSLSFDELRALIMKQVGYLGESSDLFESLAGLEQLLALPEFSGQTVDR